MPTRLDMMMPCPISRFWRKFMPKYFVTYRVWSDFQTEIEADSPEEAEDMLINNGVDDFDQDFIMSDLDYDSIDVSETE
jgi:hypothetical protein